ncbi:Uncharacterized protein DAT39_010887 [Clarias magur]|uniref:Uncharacterized protein n=1 Tax=Clarias magur TaxID=1594786 RepID=A0A8J4TK19_CLAMG|nr:Uncharacterized protein DAT39_010887 [Clarias magur]
MFYNLTCKRVLQEAREPLRIYLCYDLSSWKSEGRRSEITAWSRRSRALASRIRLEKSAACPSLSLHQRAGFRLGERRAIHVTRHESGRNPCASSLQESNEKPIGDPPRVIRRGSRGTGSFLRLSSARLMQALCCTAAHLLTSRGDQRRHERHSGTHRACLTAADHHASIRLHKSAPNTALSRRVARHQTSSVISHIFSSDVTPESSVS